MTLTPEQFNKLALKADILEIRADMKNIDSKIDKLIDIVEGLATEHKKFDQELVANVGAHDRIQEQVTRHDAILRKLAPQAF